MPTRQIVTGLVLGTCALALYATNLELSPIYLCHDEILNALNGHSIATSGRDPNGRFFPLYFYIAGDYWAQPIVTYATALVFKMLPVSEFAVRLPAALVGVTSVVLMYAVAKRIFKRELLAVISAALLAVTPAHFIHSRLGVDHLYPVPFLLAWLLCLTIFLERRQLRVLFLGTFLLGLGVYTYLASLVMMPVYFLMTWLTLFKSGLRSPRPYLVALIGFILPLLVLIPWHITHPTQYMQQVRMYKLYDSTNLNPLQGLKDLSSYTSLTARSGVYYESYNPSLLFFSGASSLINGTRKAGVFLFPIAVFLPLGLYRLITGRLTPINLVLLLGLASAPLAAAIVAEVAINRMLVMLPFAILISTIGVEYLLTASARTWRVVAAGLLLLVPVQFYYFRADYMGDYRLRSSFWFEGNIRGAVETILARDQAGQLGAVYLSQDEIQWVEAFWKFYLLEYGRQDLLDRTVYFGAKDLNPQQLPAGSVVLATANGPLKERLSSSGAFRQAIPILELNNEPSFFVFER